MTEKELIKQLNRLSEITPDENYARTSKFAIVSQGTGWVVPRQSVLTRSVSFIASVGLTAAFVLLLVVGSVTGFYKNLFLPDLEGVSTEALITEADSVTKDIDIRLSEVDYFESARTVAIVDEHQNLSPEELAGGEEEIDKLLDEVIGY